MVSWVWKNPFISFLRHLLLSRSSFCAWNCLTTIIEVCVHTEDNMCLYIAILLVINLFNPVCNLTRNFNRTFFSKDFICFILCTWVFVYVFCVCLVSWGGRRESGVTLSYCVGAGSSARAGSALNCWSSFLPTSPCDFSFKAILFHLFIFPDTFIILNFHLLFYCIYYLDKIMFLMIFSYEYINLF